MIGVIGGTGVLQGDQFTRAAEGRATESHQRMGGMVKTAGNVLGNKMIGGGAAVEGGAAASIVSKGGGAMAGARAGAMAGPIGIAAGLVLGTVADDLL